MSGMKTGAGEDPFADEPDERAGDDEPPEPEAGEGSETLEIPYKFRRENVMAGRRQVPFYLREDVQNAEAEFIDSLEAALGEDVPKADAREAAMVYAQRNPDAVAAVLREWGFDHEE